MQYVKRTSGRDYPRCGKKLATSATHDDSCNEVGSKVNSSQKADEVTPIFIDRKLISWDAARWT